MAIKHYFIHKSSQSTIQHSTNNNLPIIAITLIGILATSFLLIGYYIFIIKCRLNFHHINLLRRFSFSMRRVNIDTPLTEIENNRGLHESVIREIPVFEFKKGCKNVCECAVCLNEFKEKEPLKMIPNCNHVFHIDCIDVWLQNNANCPLCRTSISSNIINRLDKFDNQNPNPNPNPNSNPNPYVGNEDDFVVIELQGENRNNIFFPRKSENRVHDSSMGDECIDIRGNKKDDQFLIQPIRRSFSMDSSNDRQHCLAIRESVRQNKHSPVESCSSSRIRRSFFFSFGHGRSSRNAAVLPIVLDQ